MDEQAALKKIADLDELEDALLALDKLQALDA